MQNEHSRLCSADVGIRFHGPIPYRGTSLRTVLALSMVATLSICDACLSAYAPAIIARGHHANMSTSAVTDDCMGCHPSESGALRSLDDLGYDQHRARLDELSEGPPLVADWMMNDDLTCLSCHRLRGVK